MSEAETLRVMPREMRMMSERILSLTALPKGFALMASDVVMYSEAMGLGGFALLLERLEALETADPSRIALDGTRLDASGQHAWVAIPSLIDLLGLAAARDGTARIEVANAAASNELRIAEGLGAREGLAVTVERTIVTATPGGGGDRILDRVMRDGCAMPAELWWRVYDLAQTALTPDSVVSRRHAGPVIVTEDGKVIGRKDNDDDTDVSFIGSVEKRKTQGKTA
ncbi:hypothetical protein P1J78_15350 [Psychromarinibacter sp. C21-152]|uniref:Uncharacterized protein n=1 Tax=Psychromarinibacter sediminicola TaxID=3033385 RepID=A0AAE3NU94_9RHOB|nr:hypothetical protein [Psychromarinibacter sediminicola]MDF0602116.1 hypothetical protein [Psychromarinibacter sediminicola]